MSAFIPEELGYLAGRDTQGPLLGRIATVGADGTPHVVPVGFSYNPETDTIDVRGYDFERTRKFRDVARSGRAALVADDVESVDPWRVRGIEVRGRAEALTEPRPMIRIHPERIVSWGIGPRGRYARDAAEPAPAGA
jgi:pyridoxamine 5'-phosphate oxidase family protein